MAGKGGGAWKVAYADFVTAMMAFFLVMWICGQDQKVRSAVSYYFNTPFDTSKIGTSRTPSRTGSFADMRSTGSVPDSEKAALGTGRKSYSSRNERGGPTKLVADWIHANAKAIQYWHEQARQVRLETAASKEVRDHVISGQQAAVAQLTKRLRTELMNEIVADHRGVQQDLLYEILHQVQWSELAEDLLGP